jgi:hypothetical protein
MPSFLICLPAEAVEVTVDYRFDSAGFFDDPAARVVMEAAAARWSRIVDQNLAAVNMTDGQSVDGRFQIIHPETGQPYIFSAAAGPGSDFTFLATGRTVNEYLGGFSLEEDEMIVFVGSRPMNPGNVLGAGGVIGDGGNLTSVYTDANSFLNRGFNQGRDSLDVMGGFISFDADRQWNFDLTSLRGENEGTDFYSVALHELGHVFGLNSRRVAEWTEMVNGINFVGQNAVSAYNADNGTNLTSLEIFNVSAEDYHWAEGVYTSRIFPFGSPLLVGTVGSNGIQELLMVPSFRPNANVRLEISNVDAASLRDIGWSVITADPPRPPCLPVEIVPSPTGGLGVTIASRVGSVYTIQTSPDGASWVDVTPSLIGDGGTLSWTDGQEGFTDAFGNAAALDGKYYRVIQKN